MLYLGGILVCDLLGSSQVLYQLSVSPRINERKGIHRVHRV